MNEATAAAEIAIGAIAIANPGRDPAIPRRIREFQLAPPSGRTKGTSEGRRQ